MGLYRAGTHYASSFDAVCHKCLIRGYFPNLSARFTVSAPVSYFEIVVGYVGAAASKSFVIGLIILATSFLFVPVQIAHPFWMLGFLLLTCLSFSLLGFIIGIWARNFEQQTGAFSDYYPFISRGQFLFYLYAAAFLADSHSI